MRGALVCSLFRSADPYQFQVFTHIVIIIAMFYIIGLGLADEKDITIKGLEVILNLNPWIWLGSVLMNPVP
jgi:hypothetical protein